MSQHHIFWYFLVKTILGLQENTHLISEQAQSTNNNHIKRSSTSNQIKVLVFDGQHYNYWCSWMKVIQTACQLWEIVMNGFAILQNVTVRTSKTNMKFQCGREALQLITDKQDWTFIFFRRLHARRR